MPRRYAVWLMVAMPLAVGGRAGAAPPARVVIAEADGVRLQARLFLPDAGVAAEAGVVALHGCAGPLPRRDFAWARLLAGQGHAVLLPDSFASRDLPPDCKDAAHEASAYDARRTDALAAAAWLQRQPGIPTGGIFILGWSDGGTTVLAAIDRSRHPPPGLIRGAAAFYPACERTAEEPAWRPAAPLLILIGSSDDWTPPGPCAELAAGDDLVDYDPLPGAFHDFDISGDPVHVVRGLPYTLNGNGIAHAGEDRPARREAEAALTDFFRAQPPALPP